MQKCVFHGGPLRADAPTLLLAMCVDALCAESVEAQQLVHLLAVAGPDVQAVVPPGACEVPPGACEAPRGAHEDTSIDQDKDEARCAMFRASVERSG